MTAIRMIEYGSSKKAEEIRSINEAIEKETEENTRLLQMEEQVNEWTPPSPEHNGLKEFMLEQINISKNDISYFTKALTKAEQQSPLDYFMETMVKIKRDIDYYTLEQEKEIVRVKSRNEWLQQLRESLKAFKEV
jgi:hypothetical protein